MNITVSISNSNKFRSTLADILTTKQSINLVHLDQKHCASGSTWGRGGVVHRTARRENSQEEPGSSRL
jgi:hypothetical protein